MATAAWKLPAGAVCHALTIGLVESALTDFARVAATPETLALSQQAAASAQLVGESLAGAIGGALFLRTYLRSGSGWLADLEHAVLGNVAFTIGYGQWLYSGASG